MTIVGGRRGIVRIGVDGKATLVLLADVEPELMLKMADYFCIDIEEVIATLSTLEVHS